MYFLKFIIFEDKNPWLRLANYQAYNISFLQKEKGKSFSEGNKLILFLMWKKEEIDESGYVTE